MIDDDDYARCLKVLHALRHDHDGFRGGAAAQVLDEAAALMHVVKSRRRRAAAHADRERLAQTGIRRRLAPAGREPAGVPPALPPPEDATLSRARSCYVCKQRYTRLHFFYDSLCPPCAEDNYQRRGQSADLRGRLALVTGARIKIGFEIALKLLRAGATVIATTRFPADAWCRYAGLPDFADFAQRLRLYRLDLRHLAGVEELAAQLCQQLPHLDILVNNAAQTIRRPPGFYDHLLTAEAAASVLPALPQGDLDAALVPAGALDRDGQPVDLRQRNSWTLRLHEVETVELVEVQAINSIAPFLLMSRLEPLLLRSPHAHRFVINVSSMEGVFGDRHKSPRHPHTNMAKAALNMLTRTCAADLAERGVFVNSVDTGWITNEFPAEVLGRMEAHGIAPPLDEVDGAARVCDPIFAGVRSGAPLFGLFLKDYRASSW